MSGLRDSLDLLARSQRSRYLWLIPLVLAASGLELVGAALVLLLLSTLTGQTESLDLPIVGALPLDALGEPAQATFILALATAAFFALRGGAHVFRVYAQNRVIQNLGVDLATRLVEGYLRAPYPFHLQRSSADLIRNGHQAVGELVGRVLTPIITIAAEAFIVVAMVVLLLTVAPLATIAAALVLGLAAVLLLRIVQPMLRRAGQTAHAMNRDTLETLQASLLGIREVQLLGRESAFGARYRNARHSLARSNYVSSTIHALPGVTMELALIAFVLAALGIANLQGQTAGDALPVVGLFAYAGIRVQPSLQKIIGGLNDIKFSSAPIEDLRRDLRAIDVYEPAPVDVQPLPFRRSMDAEGVTFRYEGATRDALLDVSVSLERGSFIGICGPTGGGKSTLVDLLCGLLEPTQGRITIDGTDLRQVTRRWQRAIGVVPQMGFLTNESLRENIALGVPPDKIDEDAVREAVDRAQLAEVVASLPDGLGTVIGERGIRLSGGQRQRVAIARALYRRPKVLVFDEGTSALDVTTERALMAAIDRLRGEHTIIAVAHRLATVRDADRILVIEGGRITGQAPYDDLVVHHPAFRALAGG